ncbi:unnamed protein product, partial [Medioppia subpectinata]
MDDHNVFSKILIVWMKTLFKYGYKARHDLSQYLLPLCDYIKSDNSYQSWRSADQRFNANKPVLGLRLLPLICCTVWLPYLAGLVMEFGHVFVDLRQPYIIAALIDFVSATDDSAGDHLWHGVYYAVGYCLINIMGRLFEQHSYMFINIANYRLQSALTTAMYSKMLALSPGSRRTYTTGDINNMVGVDVTEVCEFTRHMTYLVSAPVSLAVCQYILWQQFGPTSLMTGAVMVTMGPFLSWLLKRMETLQTKQMSLKDKRMEQISEVLNNVKLLKLFGWERPFMARITDTRGKELDTLRSGYYFRSGLELVWLLMPYAMAIGTFTVFTLATGQEFTAKRAFVAMFVFNFLKDPMARYCILIFNGSL